MKIEKPVRVGGKMYGPGDEEALNEVLPSKDVARLQDRGVIVGEFTGIDTETGEAGEPDEDPRKDVSPLVHDRTRVAASSGGTPLPADFPAPKTMEKHGITTLEQVRALSDKQLEEMGLKPETIEKVKAAAAQA